MRTYSTAALLIGALTLLVGGSVAHASDATPDWANPASDAGTEIVQLQRDTLRVTVTQLEDPESLPFDVTLDGATGSQHLFNVIFENTGTNTISISDTPEVYVYPAGITEFSAEHRQSIGWSDIGPGQGALQDEFFEQLGLNRFALQESGQGELARWSGSGIMGGWLPLESGERIGYGMLTVDDGEAAKVFQLSLMPSDFISEEFHLLPAEQDSGETDDSV